VCFKEDWTSNPTISSLHLSRRIQKHKRLPLLQEVKGLLSYDLKPAETFLDGVDYKEEDDYDIFYNSEIKN